MQGTLEIPMWMAALGGVAAAIAVLDRLIAPSFRWYFRRRFERAVEDLNQRLSLRIQPFKLMRRSALVERLAHDPEVMAAAEAHVAETGKPRGIVLREVNAYAREIVPSFSAMMYFGVGARVSRWIGRALYRVRLGSVDEAGLSKIDRASSVVFVMNHRSNIDYLLVTHLASTSSALSYAVGEWARVWPLSRIIRAMGAYFIRRRSRDALYRAVLRRYVQMATEGGVAQAIFPEGGLSRDGALGAPKLGLLSYIVDGFDPRGPRDVVFVPVGLNYDRVLEDRLLLQSLASGERKTRFSVNVFTAFGFIAGYALGRLTGRSHKFGYACVSFGAPLSLKAFLEGGSGEGRQAEAVAALGDELTRRIGAVIPVLPVALAATVLTAAKTPLDAAAVAARAAVIEARLRAAGAHFHIPREDFDYAIEVGLRMLTLRRLVVESADGLAPAPENAEVLRYYANSIAHLITKEVEAA